MQGVDIALALEFLPHGPGLSSVLSIMMISITMLVIIYGVFDVGQELLKYTFHVSAHQILRATLLVKQEGRGQGTTFERMT